MKREAVKSPRLFWGVVGYLFCAVVLVGVGFGVLRPIFPVYAQTYCDEPATAADCSTPAGMLYFGKLEFVTAFSSVVPFVVWVLLLGLAFAAAVWMIFTVRSIFVRHRRRRPK